MRSCVGVHQNGVAGISHPFVYIVGDIHKVGDDFALRGVGHPNLKGRIARTEPTGHADEIVHREVEHLSGVGISDDLRSGGRIDQIEHTDLIVAAERALADFLKFRVIGNDAVLHRRIDIISPTHFLSPSSATRSI